MLLRAGVTGLKSEFVQGKILVSALETISEFRVSETARSWARIRDKNNFSPHEHSSGKEVSVEFP